MRVVKTMLAHDNHVQTAVPYAHSDVAHNNSVCLTVCRLLANNHDVRELVQVLDTGEQRYLSVDQWSHEWGHARCVAAVRVHPVTPETDPTGPLSPMVLSGSRLRVSSATNVEGYDTQLYVLNHNNAVVATVHVPTRQLSDKCWDIALVIADALESFADKPYELPGR